MDLGSGLTLQTRTINGKVTAGIFFGNNKASKQKLPIRSMVHPDDEGMEDKKENSKTATSRRQNVGSNNQNTKQKKDQKSRKLKPRNEQTTSASSISSLEKSDNSRKSPTGERRKPEKRVSDNKVEDKSVGKQKQKAKEKDVAVDPEPEVNTKYVTLTQGQLNTILSLVKSKNELDVSNVLENEDGKIPETEEKENDSDSKEDAQDDDKTKSKDVGKDTGNGRPASSKSGSEKAESISNLLANKNSETSKGKKKTQKSRAKTEKEKPKSENTDEKKSESSDDNNESKKKLPAVRSSFFFGETATRGQVSSAKKRENQQRWREELEQQRDEQRQRKKNERNARLKAEDEELWTKHFDTMLPVKASPRLPEASTQRSIDFAEKSKTAENADSTDRGKLHPSKSSDQLRNSGSASTPDANMADPPGNLRNSIDNSDIGGDFASTFTNTSIPQRSSYLRTMTSLLDPAQIEALEVKRKKQEEHRRAIEAQVEERKRKKEEEEERRRQLEAEEDRRLAAERDFLSQKADLEKARQQMQENMREQQTKELYQQMKNAEESALRDKLARREQILRTKGHDTSRLERTHQMTLEMSHKVAEERPLAQTSLSSIESNAPMVTGLHLPIEGQISSHVTPRSQYGAPVAVTAHTEQGPIKLEILLNKKQGGQLVESGVQTDNRSNDDFRFHFGSDSDAETEYLKLPRKTKQLKPKDATKDSKLQNFERNLNREYDKHSRTTKTVAGNTARQKKNRPRPKWGVGEKKQTFVPASLRYTAEQQKLDPVIRMREERQMLQERSRFASPSPTRHPTQRPKSPTVVNAKNRPRRDTTKHHTRAVEGNARPSSGIYATTENAKYRSEKHSRDSPVPDTKDFVQYRRTTAVLDPSIPQSRPETGLMAAQTDFVSEHDHHHYAAAEVADGDPLYNPNVVRQHERQEQILREISILRQGLKLKQREVAGYPVAMAVSSLGGAAGPTNLVLAGGGNLPERTNDTPL